MNPPAESAVVASSDLLISVILCTHNPRQTHLIHTLEALRAQSLPTEQWELMLIDSASEPPLGGRFDLSWHPRARLLREEQPGKTRAFLRGAVGASAPLLVIVDDDNVLASDYLQEAVAIGAAHPKLGAWGGNVVLEFEEPPPEWTRAYWTFLAQQNVTVDTWVCNLELSQPLPVGAGCCVRRPVVERYAAQIAEAPWRQALGPQGAALMRGEDTDLVMTACEMGLDRGLFASLRLTHLIPPERLREDYLLRLVEGIQLGGYILEMSRPPHRAPPPVDWWWRLKFGCDCLTKFGRKRRFFRAAKRAQRRARGVYEELLEQGALFP